MHPLTFEIKRVHWRATWEGIRFYRMAADVWEEETLLDMTPARFDILQAVWHHAPGPNEGPLGGPRKMPLAELRKMLGLAGATVWKCVQRLAELEWIHLVRDQEKKRRIIVVISRIGVHALRMAQRCHAEILVDRTGNRYEPMNDRIAVFVEADAERQDLHVRRRGPELVPAPPAPELVVPPPTTYMPPRPTHRERRSFNTWSYLWCLVDHLRGLAKYFQCRAGRLYFHEAEGQLVTEDHDWFFDDLDDESETDVASVDDDPDDYVQDDDYYDVDEVGIY